MVTSRSFGCPPASSRVWGFSQLMCVLISSWAVEKRAAHQDETPICSFRWTLWHLSTFHFILFTPRSHHFLRTSPAGGCLWTVALRISGWVQANTWPAETSEGTIPAFLPHQTSSNLKVQLSRCCWAYCCCNNRSWFDPAQVRVCFCYIAAFTQKPRFFHQPVHFTLRTYGRLSDQPANLLCSKWAK